MYYKSISQSFICTVLLCYYFSCTALLVSVCLLLSQNCIRSDVSVWCSTAEMQLWHPKYFTDYKPVNILHKVPTFRWPANTQNASEIQHGCQNCIPPVSHWINQLILPVPGLWMEWNAWGDCSATCGGGTRVRTRDCDLTSYGELTNPCEGGEGNVTSGACHEYDCHPLRKIPLHFKRHGSHGKDIVAFSQTCWLKKSSWHFSICPRICCFNRLLCVRTE